MEGHGRLASGVSARLGRPKERPQELRRFGLLVGGILAVITVWPVVFRGDPPRIWVGVTAGVLVALALVAPAALRLVYRAWMLLGHALGWVNTRLLLGATYFLLLLPTGLVLRVMGRDPLDRRLRDRGSYWVTRENSPVGKALMERRF